jgi:hypothetical protein
VLPDIVGDTVGVRKCERACGLYNSSILSLALPLGRLAVDVLDKIAGSCFFVSPDVLRGGVLDRMTSFAACRNLIFPAVDEPIELWGMFHIPCYFRGRRWTA